METTNELYELKEKLCSVYENNRSLIAAGDLPFVTELREKAFTHFGKLGFPHVGLEAWKGTSLEKALSHNYGLSLVPIEEDVTAEDIFKCEIPHFDTLLVTQLNGWFVHQGQPIRVYPNGLTIGSLASAMKAYPEIFKAHYGRYAPIDDNGLNALNTVFALDGFFIYVPDNVQVEDVVQIVNVVNFPKDIFIQTRNLIVLGKNSSLKLVQCDDSIDHRDSFINTVSEIAIGEHAKLDHYKLQNKDDNSALVNTICFHMADHSELSSNAISLNGGMIRNNINVAIDGEYCTANINGLFLVGKNQHIDNHVFIDHIKPNSTSNELFKGILDDHSSGVFNGHVMVRRDSQHTNAYQKNRNILLTDKATMDTRPFLEIYADDVKCSHGATVGQMDESGIFYMRQRGIPEDEARVLLLFAFAGEVVNLINIPILRERINEMIRKRLRGELSTCDDCALQCKYQHNAPCVIDLSNIQLV
jgi:Fe-S cluster assembly protein SufD